MKPWPEPVKPLAERAKPLAEPVKPWTELLHPNLGLFHASAKPLVVASACSTLRRWLSQNSRFRLRELRR